MLYLVLVYVRFHLFWFIFWPTSFTKQTGFSEALKVFVQKIRRWNCNSIRNIYKKTVTLFTSQLNTTIQLPWQYTHRQFRSAHVQTPKPYRVVLLEFRVKIFYSIKLWLTIALWTTVLTDLTGWKTGKICLVNMYAFTQTTNVAVTLLSGKYSYLDSLWNRCTSYRNASGWVKSSL